MDYAAGNHANCQRHDDRLAIHAISTNLPCDVGMEDLFIGAHQRIIASSICRIPFSDASLYSVARVGVSNILRPDQDWGV
jgi:hypothetical protein